MEKRVLSVVVSLLMLLSLTSTAFALPDSAVAQPTSELVLVDESGNVIPGVFGDAITQQEQDEFNELLKNSTTNRAPGRGTRSTPKNYIELNTTTIINFPSTGNWIDAFITLPEYGRFKIEIGNERLDRHYKVWFLTSENKFIAGWELLNEEPGIPFYITGKGFVGDYQVVVTWTDPAVDRSATLHVTPYFSSNFDDFELDDESREYAAELSNRVTLNRNFDIFYDVDWLKFNVSAPSTYALEYAADASLASSQKMIMYKDESNILTEMRTLYPGDNSPEADIAPGTYYLRVEGLNPSVLNTPYSVTLRMLPGSLADRDSLVLDPLTDVLLTGDYDEPKGTLSASNPYDVLYWNQPMPDTWFHFTSNNPNYIMTLGVVDSSGNITLTNNSWTVNIADVLNLDAPPSGFDYWCLVIQSSTYDTNGYAFKWDKTPASAITEVRIEIPGDDYPTYHVGEHIRISGGTNMTVIGNVFAGTRKVPNQTVVVAVEDPSWSNNAIRFSSVTVTTDANGDFTANVPLMGARGEFTYSGGTALLYTHHYDVGFVDATCENVRSERETIYIFGYTIHG